MRGRLTFVLQLISLLVTGWLLWRPAAASGLHSPWFILLLALVFALAASVAAGFIALALYLLLPLDPEYVLVAPLRTSTTAIWFAPAIILFAQRSPAAIVAALVLVINATRLLHDQWRQDIVPESDDLPRDLFARFYAAPSVSFWQLIAPALTGSLFVQIGLAAALLGRSVLAGFALVLGVATITIFAQKAHAGIDQRPPTLPRSGLGFLLTLVLAIGLTVGGVFPRFAGHGFGVQGDGGSASAPSPLPAGPPGTMPPEMPRGTADSGFFGVILWPEVKPYATLIEPMPQTRGGLGTGRPERPWAIPFSGEYWMYRWPFAHPPQNSYFRRGTPAEFSFSTTDHRPLQMEARHQLDQPIATDCCSSIRIELRNADRYPGTIAIELSLLEGRAQMWVGRAVVNSHPQVVGDDIRAVGETLDFPMPASAPIPQFDEFKLLFARDPRRADKSAKIAIERFVLMPK